MKTKTDCTHLLGTAMRTIDGQHIIVYIVDWVKAKDWKVTGEFNFCPKCGMKLK